MVLLCLDFVKHYDEICCKPLSTVNIFEAKVMMK